MTHNPILTSLSYLGVGRRWLYTHPGWIYSLIYISVVVIIYELLWQADFYYVPITRTTLAVALLIAIVTSAFRYGMRPAFVVAAIANLYAFWALTGPGRDIQTMAQFIRGEWAAVILFFGPAVIVGYLSERVNELLGRERQARSMAEQEQRRLTTILEQLPVGVVIADAETGQVMFGNQYLDQLLGHTRVNNDVTENAALALPSSDSPAASVPLREWPLKQVIEGQTLQSEEYAYTHEGHTHVLRVSGTPIFNTDNQITAGVVIIDDITKEKELEQRKDDFASMVSHELKTPLTSLKMYTQLMGRQLAPSSDSTILRSLAKVNAQADKLTQLINDMLALSRTKSDKLTYRFETLDAFEIISEIIEDLRTTYPDQQLQLEGQPGLNISADQYRLGQVVVNLVTNAIKYAPKANQVVITLSQQDDEVRLSIKDFGIGIAPAEQEHIFERFYQAANKNGNYPGLGIGLYLSAEIIKHHQGRIWVESELGQGSTFYVALPTQPTIPNFSSSARSITGGYTAKK